MANVNQVRTLTYNGEDIGMGFNSDTGLAVGTALTFTMPVGDPSQEGGGDVSIITSHEELMSKMHMSAQLEGHYSIVSGGGKTDFVSSTSYNSSSTFVMARIVLGNTVQRGKNFKLDPQFQHLLDSGQMDVFSKAFGDSFVRAHFNGGEFYAVMRITSVDSKKESQLAVTLHLEAEGIGAGGSFKGAFDSANSDVKTKSEFFVTFYQKGGAGANEIGTTLSLDEIKTRLHNFPDAVKNHPFPYFIEVATYDTVPLPVPSKEQLDDLLLALADCNAKKLGYLQKRNDCDFAAENQDFFSNPPTPAVLRGVSAVYTQLLNGVIKHAIDMTKGDIPPSFFDPSKLSPPLVEPTLILRKRDVGLETGFTDFWVNKDAPTTLKSVHDLVLDIGNLASDELNNFSSIVDPGGNSTITAHMQGAALAPVIASFRGYSWNHAGTHAVGRGPLTSISELPLLLPKTINSLDFSGNAIADTQGLDQFTALVGLDLSHNALASIAEIGALPVLRNLQLVDNRLSDITPLSKCQSLETLDISGNGIADLTPLGSCVRLKNLTLFGTKQFNNGVSTPSDNPIAQVLELAKISGIANPFVIGTLLAVRVGDLTLGPDAQFTGTAMRVGNSNTFNVRLTRGVEVLEDTWTLRQISAVDLGLADSFKLFFPTVVPGDVPAFGVSLNIQRTSVHSPFDLNISFVDPSTPNKCGIDVTTYPAFTTKIKLPTFDATVIS